MSDVLRLAEEVRNRCRHLQLWVTDEAAKRLAKSAADQAEQLVAVVREIAPMPATQPGRFTGD